MITLNVLNVVRKQTLALLFKIRLVLHPVPVHRQRRIGIGVRRVIQQQAQLVQTILCRVHVSILRERQLAGLDLDATSVLHSHGARRTSNLAWEC